MAKKAAKKNNKNKNQTKKNQNQKQVIYESATSNSLEVKKLFIFILIIVVLFGLFYVISLFIDKPDSTKYQQEEDSAVIQYDEIILGTLLKQTEENYYVLVQKEENHSLYSIYIDQYKTKDGALKIYTSDLENPFNKKYISEASNFDFDAVSELRIKEDTLIKIENHKLTEYYEGKTDILNELKALNEA